MFAFNTLSAHTHSHRKAHLDGAGAFERMHTHAHAWVCGMRMCDVALIDYARQRVNMLTLAGSDAI